MICTKCVELTTLFLYDGEKYKIISHDRLPGLPAATWNSPMGSFVTKEKSPTPMKNDPSYLQDNRDTRKDEPRVDDGIELEVAGRYNSREEARCLHRDIFSCFNGQARRSWIIMITILPTNVWGIYFYFFHKKETGHVNVEVWLCNACLFQFEIRFRFLFFLRLWEISRQSNWQWRSVNCRQEELLD